MTETDTSAETVETTCRKIHDLVTENKLPAKVGVAIQDTLRALAAKVEALEEQNKALADMLHKKGDDLAALQHKLKKQSIGEVNYRVED